MKYHGNIGQLATEKGTCKRTMENGMVFRIQRYICTNCRYSFVARPPSYGYGKHFPNEIKDKSVKSRVKTSLRKNALPTMRKE